MIRISPVFLLGLGLFALAMAEFAGMMSRQSLRAEVRRLTDRVALLEQHCK